MRPTVLTGLGNKSRCVQEEIFGPVVCILPFSSEAEAIDLANDTVYGLSATIWGQDGSQVHSFCFVVPLINSTE